MFASKLILVLATTTVFISCQAVEEKWSLEDNFETSRGLAEDGDMNDLAIIEQNDEEDNSPSHLEDLESSNPATQESEESESQTAKKGLNFATFSEHNAEKLNQLSAQ
jgi:hypothetical protein